MPFESPEQRKFLFANKPDVARKFAAHGKMTDKARLGFRRGGRDVSRGEFKMVLGKMKDGTVLHTLIFDKKSFPRKQQVLYWVRVHDYARPGAIRDVGGAWEMRQGTPNIDGMERTKVKCDAGVWAVIGMPFQEQPTKKSDPRIVIPLEKSNRFWGFPAVAPIAGASGPGYHGTTELPDFTAIYFSDEAKKRQQVEAEQSRGRHKSMWRDLAREGFHGEPNEVELRYEPGETSTADMVIQRQHVAQPFRNCKILS